MYAALLGFRPCCITLPTSLRARELRRVLAEGTSVMIRNSFPGRLEEVELFRHIPAAAAVAAHWPTLEHVVSTFAEAGFAQSRVATVRDEPW